MLALRLFGGGACIVQQMGNVSRPIQRRAWATALGAFRAIPPFNCISVPGYQTVQLMLVYVVLADPTEHKLPC